MSTYLKQENYREERWMIKLIDIADLHWTEERASVLKELRSAAKLSLRQLAEKMEEVGHPTNYSTLHYLESAKSQKVNIQFLQGICVAFSVKLSAFVDMVYLDTEQD